RKKEMLVTAGGKNVYPEALEARLNTSRYIAQSMIVGDGEKQLAALIVPDKANLAAFAQEIGLPADDWELLQNQAEVKSLYRKEIGSALADVAEYERVARFRLIPQEFSFEREELTPSLKIRRHIILERYRSEIQGLFRPRSSP
ncbi:MAG TPA: long-chain fatty acid--CoA ligase, partial [bacterium]